MTNIKNRLSPKSFTDNSINELENSILRILGCQAPFNNKLQYLQETLIFEIKKHSNAKSFFSGSCDFCSLMTTLERGHEYENARYIFEFEIELYIKGELIILDIIDIYSRKK